MADGVFAFWTAIFQYVARITGNSRFPKGRGRCGGSGKKVVKPSRQRKMGRHYVEAGRMSVKVACIAFGISHTCYRYGANPNAENEVIADWLVRLTTNQRNWGFGLCFLYLRNVKSFNWNHKRV